METRTIPFICTSHVSPNTRKWLQEQGQIVAQGDEFGAIHMASTHYGWLVYCDQDDDVPNDLRRVLNHMRRKGYDYVMFDRDAKPIKELPTYDW